MYSVTNIFVSYQSHFVRLNKKQNFNNIIIFIQFPNLIICIFNDNTNYYNKKEPIKITQNFRLNENLEKI